MGWWDLWNPNQINRWWGGERVYPFYWSRLALTTAVALPVALLAWLLGAALRNQLGETSFVQRGQRAAWGFAAALAIPFILLLKYRVTWLGINYGSSVWSYGFVLILSMVFAWLIGPGLRHPRLLRRLDQQGPVLVLVAMLLYAAALGSLSFARHASFQTDAPGLGVLDQAVWNTSRGRLLEYTPQPVALDASLSNSSPASPASPARGASRLASGSMELILIPLSLVYWVWADPRVLLALQTVLLASGAIPLYQWSRTRLEDGPAALLISLAYLLYLPLLTIALGEITSSALMVPFLLWAWQAAEQGDRRNYYLAIGIALLCRVDAALALFGMGGWVLLTHRSRPSWVPWDGKGAQSRGNRLHRWHGAVTAFLALAWLVLDFQVVVPLTASAYGSARHDLWPKPNELFSLDVLRVLFERERLQIVVDLLASLGGIPLLSPLTLLAALPVLVFNLSHGTYGLGALDGWDSPLARHYAPVIPFLFVASVWGASRAGQWISRLAGGREEFRLSPAEGSRLATFFALTTALFVTAFFGPLPPDWKFHAADPTGPTGYFQRVDHERSLARILDVIPADAVVSAQTGLFPHLSRRPVIYLFPTVGDADYLVLDLDYSADKRPIEAQLFYSTVQGLLTDPAFHVAAFEHGALLLRRGPGQPPPAFAEALADYSAGLYRSAIVDYRGPTRLQADDMVQTVVVMENRGTQIWQTGDQFPIFLSYHWWSPDGTLVEWNGVYNTLEQAVKPGEVVAHQVRFATPSKPGDYVLEWDLLHEYQAWFGDRGGITLRVDVTVE
jgi:uncharacterized membrane protein